MEALLYKEEKRKAVKIKNGAAWGAITKWITERVKQDNEDGQVLHKILQRGASA